MSRLAGLAIKSGKSKEFTGYWQRHGAMTHSPLMYGLIELHRRLDGEVRKGRKNLSHVRAVIEIISPGFDVSTIKPVKAYKEIPWFQKGEVILEALGVLREAEAPLSQTAIVRRTLAKRGVSNPTTAELRVVRNAIHNTLPRYEGKAVKSTGERQMRRWSAMA